MSEYSKDTLKNIISFLISEGYIKSVGNKYPILVLENKANDVLFNKKIVTIKRKIEKNKSEKSENFDTKLFEILKNLRSNIANNINVPPFIIFSDTSLKEMCIYYPKTETEFSNIIGVGTNKLKKYGQYFIDTIKSYSENNELKSYTKKSNNEKIDTKIISYNLYTNGKSIDEIANERNLTRQTIEGHLVKCFEIGMPINLEKEIQTQYEKVICDAINKVGIEKLRAIKDIVPNQVTYLDIRYYIAKLNQK